VSEAWPEKEHREAVALAMRELCCELVWRRRDHWNAVHPSRSLGLRELDPKYVASLPGLLTLHDMSSAERKLWAARQIDALERPHDPQEHVT